MIFLRQEGETLYRIIGFDRRRLLPEMGLVLALTVAQFVIILIFNALWGLFWPVVQPPQVAFVPAVFRLVVVALTAGVEIRISFPQKDQAKPELTRCTP